MDKAKKKRIKRYLTWGAMVLVVAYLTVMPLLAQNEAEADGPQASILSATAQTGSLTSFLRGGGTLQSLDAEDVNIPTGVKITEFLVKNGDFVETGTPLAVVDKVSVMEAILSVNETMEFLRTEMEDNRKETVDPTIKAVPGGRVKLVYAQEGDSVQEVMLEHGSLAVLSIDGLMAVEYEISSPLVTGQILDVTLETGETVEGRVESNLDGTVVITVEDEGYEVGQTVTAEGLGTGKLIIHNPWNATGYTGTVSRIHVKENQTLSPGATLFTLSDRDFTSQLQYRASQHREYEKLLQRLMSLYESGTINAPCDGIVSGVDKNSTHLLAAGEEGWEATLLQSRESSYQLVLLSGSVSPECDYSSTCGAETHKTALPHACVGNTDPSKTCPAESGSHGLNCIFSCLTATAEEICTAAVHKPGCIENCSEDETCTAVQPVHKPGCITHCQNSAAQCNAKTHYADCIGRCSHAGDESDCSAKYHYSDCINSCTESPNANIGCPASKHKLSCFYYGMTYKGFGAIVEQVAMQESKLIVRTNDQAIYTVERKGSTWSVASGTLDTMSMVTPKVISVDNPGDFQPQDIVLILTGYDQAGQAVWNDVVLYPMMTEEETTPNVSLPNFSIPTFSGSYGGYSGYATPQTENLHDLEGSTLLTVTPQNRMKLTISLDEQDIAKVSTGMEAQVKIEALKNQVFSAEIKKIGTVGTNLGGSSKFDLELELATGSDMLSGMSASASISLSSKESVLRIPIAAIYESEGKTLVYTALDRDSGEPATAVEVTLGISDGEYAEVLSGLSQGETVFYHYYDTLEEDTSAEAEKFTFG